MTNNVLNEVYPVTVKATYIFMYTMGKIILSSKFCSMVSIEVFNQAF